MNPALNTCDVTSAKVPMISSDHSSNFSAHPVILQYILMFGVHCYSSLTGGWLAVFLPHRERDAL